MSYVFVRYLHSTCSVQRRVGDEWGKKRLLWSYSSRSANVSQMIHVSFRYCDVIIQHLNHDSHTYCTYCEAVLTNLSCVNTNCLLEPVIYVKIVRIIFSVTLLCYSMPCECVWRRLSVSSHGFIGAASTPILKSVHMYKAHLLGKGLLACDLINVHLIYNIKTHVKHYIDWYGNILCFCIWWTCHDELVRVFVMCDLIGQFYFLQQLLISLLIHIFVLRD